MKRAIWQRSVSVDREGIPWVGGTRADFVFVLFMHGFSIEELREGLIDGFHPTTEAIEDAIRWGMSKRTSLVRGDSHQMTKPVERKGK